MGLPNDTLQTDDYKNNGISNTYILRPGVCILPLAEDPPANDDPALATYSPVVELRLHAPYRIRKMTFQNEKQNGPPVCPTPADQGLFLFVGGGLQIFNRMNATVGLYDWHVTGEYTFIENCVSRTQDGFVLGCQPFTWTSDIQNAQSLGQVSAPPVGAISQAGASAVIGYAMGNVIVPASYGLNPTGALLESWGYNCPAFFPGVLFNDQLANGGGTIGT